MLIHNTQLLSQEVPILSYSTNSIGQIEIKINSSANEYYQLLVRHDSLSNFDITSRIQVGNADSTIISENLSSYPIENYKIIAHSLTTPSDIDNDGIDDITELNSIPTKSPTNTALPIGINDGVLYLDNFSTFETLATTKDQVDWAEYLNERAYIKFAIVDFESPNPKIYFINSKTYNLHRDFLEEIGLDPFYQDMKKGEIIFHPNTSINLNVPGSFSFNLSNGFGDSFKNIQKCHELLAGSIQLVENNFAYLITSNNELEYAQDLDKYQNSRIPILLESELYADFDYWALNTAEAYGFFKKINNNETPSPRDIVLFENIPNDITRVGGIISSNFQSPLSHVNLRAIQNNIPNAFIRDILEIDSISDLLNKYIYYKVEDKKFLIREASIEEVNAWYEKLRPEKEQSPPLNLNYKEILALKDIHFEMSDAFGPKCTNVAVMNSFNFPENTIPNGYGVPFYYYFEFMKFNGFFDELREKLNESDFKNNRQAQKDYLEDLRARIKASPLPTWMIEDFSALQSKFPINISIRCRSSSNNEDLPGFSGAGLYSSKTQHPSEGHIAKSIKQVYASMWNLRAFEEREFYKINHFASAMGVLCHPNYSDEKANGVAVSFDPLYNTQDYFYLNTQADENLITNPNSNSLPEEILLHRDSENEPIFRILRYSNQTDKDSLIMKQNYLSQMSYFLNTIHNKFYELYDIKNGESFAMDIEYKITENNQLIIKQARPWVFASDLNTDALESDLTIYPNPSSDFINLYCKDCTISELYFYNSKGEIVMRYDYNKMRLIKLMPISDLERGFYFVRAIIENGVATKTFKFLKD